MGVGFCCHVSHTCSVSHSLYSTSYSAQCSFILPIEGVGLIIWWIVEEIVTNLSTWWLIEKETLATTLMEWAIVLLTMIGLNWWMGPLKIHEPKNPTTKKILGLFVKFTPRRRYFSSEDKPEFITPNQVSQLSYNIAEA